MGGMKLGKEMNYPLLYSLIKSIKFLNELEKCLPLAKQSQFF